MIKIFKIFENNSDYKVTSEYRTEEVIRIIMVFEINVKKCNTNKHLFGIINCCADLIIPK